MKNIIKCENGSVIILLSVAMLTLIISVGVAVDMARLQTARAKFSTCVDNAGLAALSKVNQAPVGTSRQDWVTEVANKYYIANCRTGYGNTSTVDLTNDNVKLSADQNTVTIDAITLQTTKFMSIAGINNVKLTAHSVVTRADQNGLEVALVLDNTGSMALTPTSHIATAAPGSCKGTSSDGNSYSFGTTSDSKICALQVAATSLIDIIFGTTQNTAPPNAWIGIVPFAQSVNIGSGSTSWLAPIPPTPSNADDFGPISSAPGASGNCPSQWGGSPLDQTVHNGPKQTGGNGTCTYQHAPNIFNHFANWYGCVEARPGNDTTETPPTTQRFPAYWAQPVSATSISTLYLKYPQIQKNPTFADILENNWLNTTGNIYNDPLPAVVSTPTIPATYPQGPNAYCTSPLTTMTNDKPTLINALGNMFPNGQTIIPVGMSWGWYMLSPKWQGIWGGQMSTNNLPKAYSDKGNIKALVFMTDGYNYFFPGSYTAYKTLLDGQLVSANPPATNEARAEAELDARTLALCTAIKAKNIQIYTVGFGQTDNVNVKVPTGTTPDVNGPLLQSCATDPGKYFFATDADTLNQDFEAIAAALSNLRIQQ